MAATPAKKTAGAGSSASASLPKLPGGLVRHIEGIDQTLGMRKGDGVPQADHTGKRKRGKGE